MIQAIKSQCTTFIPNIYINTESNIDLATVWRIPEYPGGSGGQICGEHLVAGANYDKLFVEYFPIAKVTFKNGSEFLLKPSYKSKNGKMYYEYAATAFSGHVMWWSGSSWILSISFISPQEAWVWNDVINRNAGGIYNGNSYWEYEEGFTYPIVGQEFIFKPRGENRGTVLDEYNSNAEAIIRFDVEYAKIDSYIWKKEEGSAPSGSAAGRYIPWSNLASKIYIVGVPYYEGSIYKGQTSTWYRSFEKTSPTKYSYYLKSTSTFTYGSQINFVENSGETVVNMWIIGTYGTTSWFESSSEPNINSPVTFTKKYKEENEDNEEGSIIIHFEHYDVGETYDYPIYLGDIALCL